MALDGIEIKLEQLSEALVFTEIDDSDALSDLHTNFLEVIALTDDGDEKIIVDAVEASAKLLQAILDGESDHPQDSLELIGNTLPVLLAVYRDGRSVDEVQFPSGLFPASGADGASGTDQPAAAAPPTVDTAILAEFLHRQDSVTHDIEAHILHLEESWDEEHLHALRRLIHTIKGESGMLGLYEVERICHAVEDNLEEHPIGELIDPLLALKDWLCGAFAAYSRGETPESDGSSIIASFQPSDEGEDAKPLAGGEAQGGEAVEDSEDADDAYLAKELGVITRGVAETQLDDEEGLEALQDTLERFGTWLAERSQPYAKDLAMASATTLSDILNRELKAPEIAFAKVREAIDVLDSLLGDHPEEDVQEDKQSDTDEAKTKFVAALGPLVEHIERLLLLLNEGVTAKALGELKGTIRSVRAAASEFEDKDMEALCQAADAALMKWPVVAHLDTLGEMGKWLGSASRWFAGQGAPPGPPMSIWSRFQSGPVDAPCEDAGDAPEGGAESPDEADSTPSFIDEIQPHVTVFTELMEVLSEEVTAKSLGELKAVVRTLGEMSVASSQKDMEALCQAADQALIHRPVLEILDTLADMGRWFAASLHWHLGDGAPPPPPMGLWGRFRSGQVKAPTENAAEQDDSLGTEQAGAKAAFVEQAEPCIEIFELLVDVLKGQVTAKNLGELKGLIRSLHEAASDFGDKDMEALCRAADQALIHRPASEVLDHLADMGQWLGQNVNWRAGQGAPPPPPMALWGRFQSGQAASQRVDEGAPSADGEGGPERVQSQEIDEKNREHVIQFVGEALDLVETASIHLLTLATEPDNGEAIEGIYTSYHTIKGMAGFVKLQDIRRLSGELDQLLNKLRMNALEADGVLLDVVYEASGALADLLESAQVAAMKGAPLPFNPLLPSLVSLIRGIDGAETTEDEHLSASEVLDKKLGEFLVESGATTQDGIESALEAQGSPGGGSKIGEILIAAGSTTPEAVAEALRVQAEDVDGRRLGDILVDSNAITPEQLGHALAHQQAETGGAKLGELLVRSGEVSSRDVSSALQEQRKHRKPAIEVRETVKVDSNRLNGLVDMIGELVIAQAMVSLSSGERNNESGDMVRHLGQLDKITRDLQEIGTSLRLVSVRPTFQKMARLVRDLAKKSGKQVRFVMSGESTELDKGLVDLIADPLVHMIRNAVDHGLESDPEERLALGKPPMGHVELRAFHRGGSVFIEVVDYGRGLNRDAILRKARERNIIRDGEEPAEEDICNLIFEPGFSTADAVTEVSGRGVGMDVVRRNIEELRGRVEIQSTPKKGTTFRIHLPLTLAIIDGMVVRCGDQRFVVPTLSISRLVNAEDQKVSSVFGRERMLRIEGSMVPLFSLRELFALEYAGDSNSEEVVLVLEHEEKLIAIAVHEILGQQQTVIKPLGETFGHQSGLAGGAVLSDGGVGLILDVGGLVKLSKSHIRQDVA